MRADEFSKNLSKNNNQKDLKEPMISDKMKTLINSSSNYNYSTLPEDDSVMNDVNISKEDESF